MARISIKSSLESVKNRSKNRSPCPERMHQSCSSYAAEKSASTTFSTQSKSCKPLNCESAANLVTKFPSEDFDIGMATLRGINNREHQEWIERECHWKEDCAFTSVRKLVKVLYTKIGQPEPFDSLVQYTPQQKITANSVQVQKLL